MTCTAHGGVSRANPAEQGLKQVRPVPAPWGALDVSQELIQQNKD